MNEIKQFNTFWENRHPETVMHLKTVISTVYYINMKILEKQ